MQRLDPPGVGARNLRECLLLQLTPGMPYLRGAAACSSSITWKIWKTIGCRRSPRRPACRSKRSKRCGTSCASSSPSRAPTFSESTVPSVTPDVFVERNEQGKYEVRLEDGQMPSLYISPYYRKLLHDEGTNAETREYIKRKINSAQWLIESIEQRRNTLTRVAQAIVDHQTKFLEDGPEHIEPLKMQQIADKVGVHVTTVSRAVDDKWIQTPRGIFPAQAVLRRRHHQRRRRGSRLGPRADQAAGNHRQRGQDQAALGRCLVEELAKHGITVARRTVTKYRKAMNIPSSRGRRDWAKSEK